MMLIITIDTGRLGSPCRLRCEDWRKRRVLKRAGDMSSGERECVKISRRMYIEVGRLSVGVGFRVNRGDNLC